MTISRPVQVSLLAAVCGLAAAVVPSYAAPGTQITLRPAVRIQSPGQTALTCPVEGEPSVARTSAGSWVAYNDDQGCPANPTVTLHLTGVQLIPAAGGAPRYVQIVPPKGDYISGDPALTADPQHAGSVLLATLEQTPAGLALGVYSITPALQVTELPVPTVNPKSPSDDKEFIASDLGAHSRWRGRTYLVWDDFAATNHVLTFRAFNGREWADPVRLAAASGAPDVAVAPNGDVGVAYETSTGVAVRISHDGGRTFTPELAALTGDAPGRMDPACPLRPTVGQRQRVLKSARVVYDTAGVLHVVAALGGGGSVLSFDSNTVKGAATGGLGIIQTATTRDGLRVLSTTSVAPPQGGDVQFDPAISRTPQGGVAVEWLQTTGTPQTSFQSWLSVARPGNVTFGRPVQLSDNAAAFPPAFEAFGNSDCYGIGDYTGLAATRDGVVAVWPTSGTQVTPYFDTDVLAREAVIR